MARNQSPIVSWSEYLGLRGVAGLLGCFDVEQNLSTAATVGSLFYRLNARRRRRAERHIALSFPEWPEARVRHVAEASMQHMFQLFMVDTLVMPRLITPSSWRRYVRLGDVDRIIDLLDSGRPMLLFTAHCGNWELLGHTLSMMGHRIAALARPLDNPHINRWLMELRQAHGLRIITKWGATPVIANIIDGGGRVGFIADQNAGEQGLFVPFFGRLASTYKSIGLLAMRYGLPIAGGYACRIGGRMQYELRCPDIIMPEEWADHDDPLYYITSRVSRAMEQMILAAPEQYLWLHRRWKSRPRHERLGRPMPARLRGHIEALPWMTPDELDRIVSGSEDPAHQEER